jgi:cytidylate kinase
MEFKTNWRIVMSIVALFPDTLAQGREVALQLAARTGYTLRTAEDIVASLAEKSNHSLKELSKALQPLSFPWHQSMFKQRIKDRLLLDEEVSSLIKGDNLIYQGFLGYPLFRQISHALRVRVLHGPSDSAQKAGKPVEEETKQTRKWVREAYHLNIDDPSLYDAVVNLEAMSAAEGAQVIHSMLQQKRFTPMTYSLHCTENLLLTCKVKSMLRDRFPDTEVKSHSGAVFLYSKRLRRSRKNVAEQVKADLLRMEDVNYVEVFGERKAFKAAPLGQ